MAVVREVGGFEIRTDKTLSCAHILGIKDLALEDIELILARADRFFEMGRNGEQPLPSLQSKTVLNLFYEPSTRTRISFEIAAKRLGAVVVNFDYTASSEVKGELLIDTVRTLVSMHADLLVFRHPNAGAAHLVARYSGSTAVVNSGDGMHEHPTQALLDALIIRREKGAIEGLEVAIVGDILHSRVARSTALLLRRLGARVRVWGPRTLMPIGFDSSGIEVADGLREALISADVVIGLRVQQERQRERFFPSGEEYHRFYGLSRERLQLAKPDAIFMHPGPMNRGVEVDSHLADGASSSVLSQVEAGVAVRMAVMELLIGSVRKTGHE